MSHLYTFTLIALKCNVYYQLCHQMIEFEEILSNDTEFSFTFVFSLNKTSNPEPWERVDPSKPQKVTNL